MIVWAMVMAQGKAAPGQARIPTPKSTQRSGRGRGRPKGSGRRALSPARSQGGGDYEQDDRMKEQDKEEEEDEVQEVAPPQVPPTGPTLPQREGFGYSGYRLDRRTNAIYEAPYALPALYVREHMELAEHITDPTRAFKLRGRNSRERGAQVYKILNACGAFRPDGVMRAAFIAILQHTDLYNYVCELHNQSVERAAANRRRYGDRGEMYIQAQPLESLEYEAEMTAAGTMVGLAAAHAMSGRAGTETSNARLRTVTFTGEAPERPQDHTYGQGREQGDRNHHNRQGYDDRHQRQERRDRHRNHEDGHYGRGGHSHDDHDSEGRGRARRPESSSSSSSTESESESESDSEDDGDYRRHKKKKSRKRRKKHKGNHRYPSRGQDDHPGDIGGRSGTPGSNQKARGNGNRKRDEDYT